MRRAPGAPWGRKPAHERWSTRRCDSTRHPRRPSICGPKARHRPDIYRSESINIGPRKRGVIFPGRVPESMAMKIRRRSRLRRKEVTNFLGRLGDEFGMAVPLDDVPLDEAEAGPHRLLLRENDAIPIFLDGGIAPTIRGLLVFPAKKRAVTVDMGAVRFIYNGADVMAPGIVDADPGIRAGDIVWVRDEKNGRPLAIGRAIMEGAAMAREEKGKAIQTIHHVGDEIWRLGGGGPCGAEASCRPLRHRRDAPRHARRVGRGVRCRSRGNPEDVDPWLRGGAMDRHSDRSHLCGALRSRGRRTHDGGSRISAGRGRVRA